MSENVEANTAPATEAAPKVKRTPYSHLFRITHWLLSLVTLVLIYTGVAVHCLARPDWSFVSAYPALLLDGRVLFWHLLAGTIFAPTVVIAAVIFFSTRRKVKFLSWRWIANVFLLVGGLGCVISMLGLIYTDIPMWLYHLSRATHAICGMFIIPLALLLHIVRALTKHFRLLVPVYAPLRQANWLKLAWIPATIVIAFLVIAQTPSRMTSARVLTAKKIDVAPANLEAVPDLPWDDAKALELTLVNGSGHAKGISRVCLKAFRNDEHLFVKASWTDRGRSRNYWPWLKTEDGWRKLLTSSTDEQVYYEDKFSMIFPIEPDPLFTAYGCAIYCHTEAGSYGNKGAARKVDVWHWKASRTGVMNYADDKHWLGHDTTLHDVGRIADPKTGGGDAKNNSEDKTTPAFLPASPGASRHGALVRAEAVPYSEELAAKIPAGVLIPGTVVARALGDRGDVAALAQHSDEGWTLYLMRKLDTGSEHDVIFEPGGTYDFACAAFDHAAKRHAYNQQVYRLVIEQ